MKDHSVVAKNYRVVAELSSGNEMTVTRTETVAQATAAVRKIAQSSTTMTASQSVSGNNQIFLPKETVVTDDHVRLFVAHIVSLAIYDQWTGETVEEQF